jgi:hypothetical protein
VAESIGLTESNRLTRLFLATLLLHEEFFLSASWQKAATSQREPPSPVRGSTVSEGCLAERTASVPFEHVAQLRFPAAQPAIDRVFRYAEEFGYLGRRQIFPVRQLDRDPLESGYLP